jgi:hypothetical protein
MNTPIEIPSASSASSAPSALNSDVRNHRGLSRLAGLSPQQLDRINTWLDDAVPYRKIVELCRTEFQVDIPHMTIARYNKRSVPRQLLKDLTDSKEAAAQISQYAATGDATFSGTTLEILEQQAFDLATAFHRDHDLNDLATLGQISNLIHKAKNTAVRERHAKVQEQKCALRHEELAHKCDMDDFRKQIANENLEIQKRHLQLAEEKNSKTSKRNPLPRNWKEVGERVRIGHGISKEEWARRQALHDKYDENGNLKPTENLCSADPNHNLNPSAVHSLGVPPLGGLSPMPNENCSTLDPQRDSSPTPLKSDFVSRSENLLSGTTLVAGSGSQISIPEFPSSSSAPSANSALIPNPVHPVNPIKNSSSSAASAVSAPSALIPSSQSEHPALLATIDSYNIRRAHEYWAWRTRIAQLPDGVDHPQYITQSRHCPCGAASPCPVHENETYGEFPTFFWSISPHHSAYANCLQFRNLPYRDPAECIPAQFRS